tara:strand:+ start:611 stop:799 length:189 start_codon:yes stop_codon:yes gene_type:complete
MVRENKIKSLLYWIGEIREEIEIQIYGIIGAIFFFVIFYLVFKPSWMKTVFDVFLKSKLNIG